MKTKPNILDFDKITNYADALEQYADECDKVIKIASFLLALCEKDSCYYCPLHCDRDTYAGCVDPERAGTVEGCRANYWEKYLREKSTLQ